MPYSPCVLNCFRSIRIIAILSAAVLVPVYGGALEVEEVLVIANDSVKQSVELAKFYMRLRNIPQDNLLFLDVTGDESCSRQEYNRMIANPIN